MGLERRGFEDEAERRSARCMNFDMDGPSGSIADKSGDEFGKERDDSKHSSSEAKGMAA
jgi:hypothetical protein